MLGLLTGLSALAAMQACEHDEILLNQPKAEDRALGIYLSNNSDYSIFAYALDRVGLMDSLLLEEQSYTVLGLKNVTLRANGIYSKADIDNIDITLLRDILSYHIIPSTLMIEDIPRDQYNLRYNTLGGHTLQVHRTFIREGNPIQLDAEMVSFSGSYVINHVSEEDDEASQSLEANMRFTNGVLHNISKMIKYYPQIDVQSFLEQTPEYSIFVAGLKRFDLWERLADPNLVTVFAPVNSTFLDFGIDEELMSEVDPTRYNRELLFGAYIMDGRLFHLSDYNFFLQKESQYWISNPIPTAPHYNFIVTGGTFDYSGGNFVHSGGVNCTIGISELDQPLGYSSNPDTDCTRFLGTGPKMGGIFEERECIATTIDKAENDYRLKNGIVHKVVGILTHFDEALIRP